MKKILLIPLLIISFFALGQTGPITPQWRAVTGGITEYHPGKTPSGYDSLMYYSWLRQHLATQTQLNGYVSKTVNDTITAFHTFVNGAQFLSGISGGGTDALIVNHGISTPNPVGFICNYKNAFRGLTAQVVTDTKSTFGKSIYIAAGGNKTDGIDPIYGPYQQFGNGPCTYYVMLRTNSATSTGSFTLDVAENGTSIQSQTISLSQFTDTTRWYPFFITFTARTGYGYEFRINANNPMPFNLWMDYGNIQFSGIIPYTAGYGLNLTANQFKIDTTFLDARWLKTSTADSTYMPIAGGTFTGNIIAPNILGGNPGSGNYSVLSGGGLNVLSGGGSGNLNLSTSAINLQTQEGSGTTTFTAANSLTGTTVSSTGILSLNGTEVTSSGSITNPTDVITLSYGNSHYAASGSGITNVSSTTSDISVANPTTTPSLTLIQSIAPTSTPTFAGTYLANNTTIPTTAGSTGTFQFSLNNRNSYKNLATGYIRSEYSNYAGSSTIKFPNLATTTLADSTAAFTALAGKQATGNYITALTGDGTSSGPGSSAFMLATVNSNVGTFNNVTVNGKGLVTAASNVSYQAPLSFDTAPTNGSSNPVTSGGIYTALQLYGPLAGTNNWTGTYNQFADVNIGGINPTTQPFYITANLSGVGLSRRQNTNSAGYTGDDNYDYTGTLQYVNGFANTGVSNTALAGAIYYLSPNNISFRWLSSTSNVSMNENATGLSLGALAPTHSLTIPSTGTGWAIHNQTDQVTNYERFRAFWAGNVAMLATDAGGTGTIRDLKVQSGSVSMQLSSANANITTNTRLWATGGIQTDISSTTANFAVPASNTIGGSVTTNLFLMGGSAGVNSRVSMGGSTISTITIGNSYFNNIIGSSPIQTPTSGTNAVIGSLGVKYPTVTSGGSTIGKTVAAYFQGGASGTYNTWFKYGITEATAIRVDSLIQYFGSSSGSITEQVPATITNYTITRPASAPTANGQALVATTGGAESWATVVSGFTFLGKGQVTLSSGVATISLSGVTTSTIVTTGYVSQGGTISTTIGYKVVCTSGTITITAVTASGTTDTTDTSTLNYFASN